MISIVFIFVPLIAAAEADLVTLNNDAAYDEGVYGSYVSQHYVSTGVEAPRFNLWIEQESSEDESYNFLTPHGFKVTSTGPAIVDTTGALIWTSSDYGKALDFRVQQYAGQDCLTFWAGNGHVRGHGSGSYYILDSAYRLVKNFTAGNGPEGDLHEFTITEDGTALITVYQKIHADLSHVSRFRSAGHIWDCLFQEIDLENDSVLFQWRASHHRDLTAGYRSIGFEGSDSHPWDWFHINSVDKDSQGNYLISSRYLQNVAYVSGVTGKILWDLGGKTNDCEDISKGNATNFAYQHHARWVSENSITLFDNAVDYEHKDRAPYSRGLRLALDTSAMNVRLLAEFVNPLYHASPSQGSLHLLRNGNALMGFGSLAAFTEFSPQGTIIRDTHFGPAAQFLSDNVQSYRVFRFAWKGHPDSQPEVAIRGNSVYVSWNGATEVRSWILQHADNPQTDKDGYSDVISIEKTGFETQIHFNQSFVRRLLRLAAVDARGDVIGVSATAEWARGRGAMTRVLNGSSLSGTRFITALAVIVAIIAIFIRRRLRAPSR